jgi:hypothetical protein
MAGTQPDIHKISIRSPSFHKVVFGTRLQFASAAFTSFRLLERCDTGYFTMDIGNYE